MMQRTGGTATSELIDKIRRAQAANGGVVKIPGALAALPIARGVKDVRPPREGSGFRGTGYRGAVGHAGRHVEESSKERR